MMVKKQVKMPTPLQVKLSAEERKTLEAIRDKRGVKMTSEMIRLMIREEANREGVTV